MRSRPYPVLFAVLASALVSGCGASDTTPQAEDTAAAAVEASATETPPANEPAPATALLDPESADHMTLMSVPHISGALADQLIAERPFGDMREVEAILAPTLDETQRDEVYTRLFKPLDLNSATEEEILLIPGVGDQMAHEFEEYRPYVGIEQFRREIGKYVDPAEVARLEQYVRIP